MSREEKIHSCLNLAYKIAHKYRHKGICIGALKSEAHMQLIRAVDAHVPSKGALTTIVYHYVSNGLRKLFRQRKQINLHLYKATKQQELKFDLIEGICLADIEYKLKKYTKYQRELLAKRYGLFGEEIHDANKLSILYNKSKDAIIADIKAAMMKLKAHFPKCRHCKKRFEKTFEHRANCSKFCRIRSKKLRVRENLPVKTCAICNSSYRPKMKKQVVCCHKCNRQKQLQDKRAKPETRKCLFCKTEFTSKKKLKVFCTKKCNFKHYWLYRTKLKAS